MFVPKDSRSAQAGVSLIRFGSRLDVYLPEARGRGLEGQDRGFSSGGRGGGGGRRDLVADQAGRGRSEFGRLKPFGGERRTTATWRRSAGLAISMRAMQMPFDPKSNEMRGAGFARYRGGVVTKRLPACDWRGLTAIRLSTEVGWDWRWRRSCSRPRSTASTSRVATHDQGPVQLRRRNSTASRISSISAATRADPDFWQRPRNPQWRLDSRHGLRSRALRLARFNGPGTIRTKQRVGGEFIHRGPAPAAHHRCCSDISPFLG